MAAVIGFEELFRQGQLTVATTYKAFEVYLAVAIVYLVMTSLASMVFKRLEVYMDPINRPKKAAKEQAPSGRRLWRCLPRKSQTAAGDLLATWSRRAAIWS